MASNQVKTAPDSVKHRVLLQTDVEAPSNQDTFSFVTYNVLADCHAQRDYASSYDPQHIDADFRHEQIIKELEYLDGDIVCLQEVTPHFYDGKLKDWFTKRGFASHFIKRISLTYDEGCATFYRSDKFTCKTVQLLDLSKITEDLFKFVVLDEGMKQTVAERYSMHDVAIITELRRAGTDHVITVANTHVDFGEFKKPDLQALQIACLKWILNQKFSGSPAILCGDFNMSPDSPQYIFATEDILSDQQWELLREKAQIQTDLVDVLKTVVSQSQGTLKFRSMYKHLKGQEPEVTCVDSIYRHCLDYVFYREQLALDTTQGQGKTKPVCSKLIPLQVLDTLPLEHVLKNVPPSEVYSSDHFPLFVKFGFEP